MHVALKPACRLEGVKKLVTKREESKQPDMQSRSGHFNVEFCLFMPLDKLVLNGSGIFHKNGA